MPTVTDITEQKRRPNRRSVFLDGSFAFGCNVNVIAKFRLVVGAKMSAAQVEQVLQGGVRQECFDDAMRSLQRRLHSRTELRKKLTRKEFGSAIVDAVLDDLARLGYLDDVRFAKTRALAAAQHKHHGKRRAKMELVKAGVKADTADMALSEVYDSHDSLAVARDLAQRQAQRLKKLEPTVARRRLVGMLQRRGFDYETIKPVVDQVLGNASDEN